MISDSQSDTVCLAINECINDFYFFPLFFQRGSDELNMYGSSPNSMTGTLTILIKSASANTTHHHLKLESTMFLVHMEVDTSEPQWVQK